MKWLAALLLLTVANGAVASQATQPFVRGSFKKIVAAHTGKPFIVALWSISCTHCSADLEIFEQMAKKHSNFNLVLISTDSPEANVIIARTLAKYHLGLAEAGHKRAGHIESWVFADTYTERLRFEIDAQWYGELPRTYFFDAKGLPTAVSGVLDATATEQWLSTRQ